MIMRKGKSYPCTICWVVAFLLAEGYLILLRSGVI